MLMLGKQRNGRTAAQRASGAVVRAGCLPSAPERGERIAEKPLAGPPSEVESHDECHFVLTLETSSGGLIHLPLRGTVRSAIRRTDRVVVILGPRLTVGNRPGPAGH